MKAIYNCTEIQDKIKACWLGKSIGGTIGAPYEWKREFEEVTGFTTPPGKMFPNDDLDLQLIWLLAMEIEGPKGITPSVLGEYWITNIPPYWNEYGNGKANLKMGLLPPFSGEYANEKWKTSNGAWIRSEIWACLAPGVPEIALKYAMMDASVDHGIDEGTFAAIFTASLQCNGFFETDIKKNIEYALQQIPQDSRVAKAIALTIECYEKKIPARETRNMLIKQSEDIGWFQAPANVGFAVLGLLYGEGDFKKSVLHTVNCGDDADCSCGMVGSVLGIMFGTKIIPEDWSRHVGDAIITTAVNGAECRLPLNCTELSERVYKLIPQVLKHGGIETVFKDGVNSVIEGDIKLEDIRHANLYTGAKLSENPLSYQAVDNTLMYGHLEFEELPVAKSGNPIVAHLKLINRHRDPRQLCFRAFLPEGWSAEYKRSEFMQQFYCQLVTPVFERADYDYDCEWTITITPGENIDAINRIPIEITSPGRPTAIYFPIILLG